MYVVCVRICIETCAGLYLIDEGHRTPKLLTKQRHQANLCWRLGGL